MDFMSITNFESTTMADLNIMAEDLNTTAAEDLSPTAEGSATVEVQSTVAGMSNIIMANRKNPDSNNLPN